MLHKGSFIVVLDACVLYPFSLRDILLRLAEVDLYRPKWTEDIKEEWVTNLANNEGIEKDKLSRTVRLMNRAFPEALIRGYTGLINVLKLPDPNDRHVLAAAIRVNADLIITNNIKDFPASELGQYDIEAQTADTFIQNLIDLDTKKCCEALRNLLNELNNPPLSQSDYLKRLERSKLKKSARLLKNKC